VQIARTQAAQRLLQLASEFSRQSNRAGTLLRCAKTGAKPLDFPEQGDFARIVEGCKRRPSGHRIPLRLQLRGHWRQSSQSLDKTGARLSASIALSSASTRLAFDCRSHSMGRDWLEVDSCAPVLPGTTEFGSILGTVYIDAVGRSWEAQGYLDTACSKYVLAADTLESAGVPAFRCRMLHSRRQVFERIQVIGLERKNAWAVRSRMPSWTTFIKARPRILAAVLC